MTPLWHGIIEPKYGAEPISPGAEYQDKMIETLIPSRLPCGSPVSRRGVDDLVFDDLKLAVL